jgi:hypothetical protein
MPSAPLIDPSLSATARTGPCFCADSRLLACDSSPTGRNFILRRLHYLRFAAIVMTIRLGRGAEAWAIRRLNPECPVRRSLESLTPLVDLALSVSSRDRRVSP